MQDVLFLDRLEQADALLKPSASRCCGSSPSRARAPRSGASWASRRRRSTTTSSGSSRPGWSSSSTSAACAGSSRASTGRSRSSFWVSPGAGRPARPAARAQRPARPRLPARTSREELQTDLAGAGRAATGTLPSFGIAGEVRLRAGPGRRVRRRPPAGVREVLERYGGGEGTRVPARARLLSPRNLVPRQSSRSSSRATASRASSTARAASLSTLSRSPRPRPRASSTRRAGGLEALRGAGGVLLGERARALAHPERAAGLAQLALERLALAPRRSRCLALAFRSAAASRSARLGRRALRALVACRAPARRPPRSAAASSRAAEAPCGAAPRRPPPRPARGHAPPACASRASRPAASASRSASSPAAACSVVRRRSAIARESGRAGRLQRLRGGHDGVDRAALGERRLAQAAAPPPDERRLLRLAQRRAGVEQRLDQLRLLARDLVGRPGGRRRLGQLRDDAPRSRGRRPCGSPWRPRRAPA